MSATWGKAQAKLETSLDRITFMGHLITKDGIQVDPAKVKAITDMPTPARLEELQRFLRMVNYVGKFIPNLSTIAQPLHNLTATDVNWTWAEPQNSAFENLELMISNTPVLGYYDPQGELTLENDASEYGLGSALMQDGKPVAYASRSLLSAERQYAQIEKEMLAVVYGLEKFHHYTFGRNVFVVTDHKPLISICLKPLSKVPKRLQNLMLWAQQYDFNLKFKPEEEIPIADTLSRAPLEDATSKEIINVHNLTLHPIKDNKLAEIRMFTAKDTTLTSLGEAIMRG